jgi:hypothetical protein
MTNDELKLKQKTIAELEEMHRAMLKLGYPSIAEEVETEIAVRRTALPGRGNPGRQEASASPDRSAACRTASR